METLSLQCIKYAESTLPESMVFDGGSDKVKIPISFAFFLVESGCRKILIDAGCDTMPGFDMRDFCSPPVALRQVGVSPEDITDVVITHAHHDHIEAVSHYKNATVYINRKEFEAGKRYIPQEMSIVLFDDELTLSERMRVVTVAGHSAGSAIVEIICEDAVLVLCGDECYTNANIAQRRCTGTYYDKGKAIAFIEKYSGDGYRVYTCHDSSLKTDCQYESVHFGGKQNEKD